MQTSQTSGQQSSEPTVEDRLNALRAAWHPNSPDCRFQVVGAHGSIYYRTALTVTVVLQTFFYNIVDPSHVAAYGRPALAVNDAAWLKACRENPDPDRYNATRALGDQMFTFHAFFPQDGTSLSGWLR